MASLPDFPPFNVHEDANAGCSGRDFRPEDWGDILAPLSLTYT